MTEEQKMLAGKLYDPSDSRLEKRRQLAHRLSKEYNDTLETDAEKRKAIMAELLPDCGEGTFLQGPKNVNLRGYTFNRTVWRKRLDNTAFSAIMNLKVSHLRQNGGRYEA